MWILTTKPFIICSIFILVPKLCQQDISFVLEHLALKPNLWIWLAWSFYRRSSRRPTIHFTLRCMRIRSSVPDVDSIQKYYIIDIVYVLQCQTKIYQCRFNFSILRNYDHDFIGNNTNTFLCCIYVRRKTITTPSFICFLPQQNNTYLILRKNLINQWYFIILN